MISEEAERATSDPTVAVAVDPLLSLDVVTRQRLRVAEVAADALEVIAAGPGSARLDATFQAHVVDHATRMVAFLADLRRSRAIRANEEILLTVRRLERRLEIGAELLTDAARGAVGPDGAGVSPLFYGDFTEPEANPDAARRPSEARSAPRRRSPRKRREAGLSSSVLRLIGLAAAGALVIVISIAWNGVSRLSEPVKKASKPPHSFEPRAHLEDMRAFFPAKFTSLRDGTLSVIVDREWLLRSPDARREDAVAAHVWLLNRNVPRLVLSWDDGRVIASFERERMSWHETEGTMELAPIDW